MRELYTIREPTGIINEPKDIFKKIKRINIDYTQENVICFFLNARKQVIHSEIIFKGGPDSCILDPRTVFRKALLHNAVALIYGHNHPSGCLDESPEDRDVYERLKQVGDVVGVRVLDSVIFNQRSFMGMGPN